MKNLCSLLFVFLTVIVPLNHIHASGETVAYQKIGFVTVRSILGADNESIKKNEILAMACNEFLSSWNHPIPRIYLSIQFSSIDSCQVKFEPFSSPGVSDGYQKAYYEYAGLKITGVLSGNRIEKVLLILEEALLILARKKINVEQLSLNSKKIYNEYLKSVSISNLKRIQSSPIIRNISQQKFYRSEEQNSNARKIYYYSDSSFHFLDEENEYLQVGNIFEIVSLGNRGICLFDTEQTCYIYDFRKSKLSNRITIPRIYRSVSKARRKNICGKIWKIEYYNPSDGDIAIEVSFAEELKIINRNL